MFGIMGVARSSGQAASVATPPPTPAFSPIELFALGEEGGWFDPSDLSTLWQDTAGTVPAVVGDPVGRIDDKSGRGNNALQATAGNRPILRQDSDSAYYLEFDGSGDVLTMTQALATPMSACLATLYNSGTVLMDNTVGTNRFNIYLSSGLYTLAVTSAVQTYITPAAKKEALITTFDGASSWFEGRNGGRTVTMPSATPAGVVFGSAYTPGFGANCRMYQMIICDRAFTAGERASLKTWMHASRLLSTKPATLIVCDGNSITLGFGVGASDAYPAKLGTSLGNAYAVVNYGVTSQTTANMSSDAATQIDSTLPAYSTSGVLIAWEATNDIYSGADLATCQSRWNTYFSARASAGWASGGSKLVAMTCIARGNFPDQPGMSAILNSWNTWLRANYTMYATHLVDLAADARLSDFNDTTYYQADKCHLTSAGNAVVAGLIEAALF